MSYPREEQDTVRIPPHNDDAERCVLGGILLDNRIIDEVLACLSVEDFYREPHRHVFRAMRSLHGQGVDIDVISIADNLSGAGVLDAVGGASYLARLSNAVPSAANLGTYVKIVSEKASLRRFIAKADAAVHDAYGGVEDVQAFMEQAEAGIFSAMNANRIKGTATAKEVMAEATVQIEQWHNQDSELVGVPSGLSDVDELTLGWQDGDLIILAARPGMGKTSLALCNALHASVNLGVPSLFFSLEMPNAQLGVRLICTLARVNQEKMKRGLLTTQEWSRVIKAAGDIASAPMFFDDSSGVTIQSIRAKARRLKAEHDIGMVFVDYLQLVHDSGRHNNRNSEVESISRSMKEAAKELELPWIALAQLNRNLESRADKRPQMADLRDSGSIEQDADVIGFIYRDEVYNEDTEERGIAEVIIRKNRNGSPGTAKVRFFGEQTRFESLAPEYR